MEKVTIVIPVYNAEKTISKCIDSILNQTNENYQVLLIDDGSKDNSLKVIKEYEKNYPKKIKVPSRCKDTGRVHRKPHQDGNPLFRVDLGGRRKRL